MVTPPWGADWLDRTYFDLGLSGVSEDDGTPLDPRNDLVIDLDALPDSVVVTETETELIFDGS